MNTRIENASYWKIVFFAFIFEDVLLSKWFAKNYCIEICHPDISGAFQVKILRLAI